MIKIAVSSGDPAGIGPDICIKAFGQKRKYNFFPVIFGDREIFEARAQDLGIQIATKAYKGQEKELSNDKLWIVDQKCDLSVIPGKPNPECANFIISNFRNAVDRTISKEFDAVVTCPINKEVINKGGIEFTGHTEELARLAKIEKVVMMLTSDKLRVALATTHLPLREVPQHITPKNIEETLLIINKDLQEKYNLKSPLIKVLGLNPHAGDGGYIGSEEQEVLVPAIKKLTNMGLNISGPYSADTAFIKNDDKTKPDIILAMYHDQGLPALKTLGFRCITNVTLGLPFIRTSVDHGTAYDIAGSAKADESSLIEATKTAAAIASS
jgi:4-hydroxythreonine-4-phosphate dehydrogenase|tara:strand:+ start:5459 stop:6436 length:978 start_codon:yes stop_codon:yes gene_type:complete